MAAREWAGPGGGGARLLREGGGGPEERGGRGPGTEPCVCGSGQKWKQARARGGLGGQGSQVKQCGRVAGIWSKAVGAGLSRNGNC